MDDESVTSLLKLLLLEQRKLTLAQDNRKKQKIQNVCYFIGPTVLNCSQLLFGDHAQPPFFLLLAIYSQKRNKKIKVRKSSAFREFQQKKVNQFRKNKNQPALYTWFNQVAKNIKGCLISLFSYLANSQIFLRMIAILATSQKLTEKTLRFNMMSRN